MLRGLVIRHFVLVEQLELEFRDGFTVLTGETGAGKSILIDALSLVLGERADPGRIQMGAERAEVSAEFELATGCSAREWLSAKALEADDQCVLRRQVDRQGKSRAFVNGQAVTLADLRELAQRLVDIHGQHAHQTLLQPATQRQLLDDFGGARAAALEVQHGWRTWQTLLEQHRDWQRSAAQWADERQLLQEEISALAALGDAPLRWDALEAEQRRLGHAQALLDQTREAIEVLGEGEQALRSPLAQVVERLRGAVALDAGLEPALTLIDSALIALDEGLRELRHYERGMDLDDQRLAEVERDLQRILAAARRWHLRPDAMAGRLADVRARLESGEKQSDESHWQTRLVAAQAAYQEAARQLSELRGAAATRLGERVSDSLGALAMGQARFAVALNNLDQPGPRGLESVEFQVSSHVSLELAPLARVASGGELARLSLAIQNVLTAVSSTPTLVFDEVDSGIGGRVADTVGALLATLGEHHQVLCVTHLPQVAAHAHHHYRVIKEEAAGQVQIALEVLGDDARVEELARMLGGATLTETTRRHAREMLGSREPT